MAKPSSGLSPSEGISPSLKWLWGIKDTVASSPPDQPKPSNGTDALRDLKREGGEK